jgi:(p)ppGpp synthase/HD superfamily hydrolase
MKDDTFTLEKAISLAALHHEGQLDKAGFPYILHPLRVMYSVETLKEKMVAVLHDTFEDTDLTMEELINLKCPFDVIQAIDCLTKRKNEKYDDFITRIIQSKNYLALQVKLADIKDNLDPKRVQYLSPLVQEKLFKKYLPAQQRLLKET